MNNIEPLSLNNKQDLVSKESTATIENTKPDYIWDLTKTPGLTSKEILGKLLQYVNIAEIADKIEITTEYIVQIPAEFREAVKKGEMFIMHNDKTNKMWPTLMRLTENNKQEIVTPLPVVQKEVVQGTPLKDLTQGYQNVLIQQQMAKLTQQVGEVYKVVESIEAGQMDDKIGLLEAGRNQIALAMTINDPEKRQREIEAGRTNLLIAQGQLYETLQRKAKEFPNVPRHRLFRVIQQAFNDNYFDGLDKKIEILQDYYNGYLQSTKLISASYALTGDDNTANKAFEMATEKVKSITFDKAKTYTYANAIDGDHMFYNNPVEILITEKAGCLNCFEEPDMIELKVNGKQLLGVVEDV